MVVAGYSAWFGSNNGFEAGRSGVAWTGYVKERVAVKIVSGE